MIDQLIVGTEHLVVGGIAANLLLIISLTNVALGGQGSHVSPQRRLASDSDSQLFLFLFAIGGVCGIVVAALSGFVVGFPYFAATAAVGFVTGLITALPRVAKLNEAYLERAENCLEDGEYKEAIEDASEVARSSERLRSRANQIIAAARELRSHQPLDRLSLG